MPIATMEPYVIPIMIVVAIILFGAALLPFIFAFLETIIKK